jgi:uncharacterized protein with PIN domain
MKNNGALAQLRKRLKDQLAYARGAATPGTVEKTVPEFLADVAAKVAFTNEQELSCDECAARLDHFVERALAGDDVEQLLPMVQHHLMVCGECREEYESLLRIVRKRQRAEKNKRADR